MCIVHRIDMVIWLFKAGWVHFWSMASNCSLGRSCVGCIRVFVEVFGLWSIFMIVMKELFSGWLFIYEQCSSEGTSRYLFIILHWKFSHSFVFHSTSKTVFFQVYNWWGPWYFIGYGLILLTVVLIDVLTLIWTILVVKCISKILVDSGFNHGMGCWHVYIWCF